MRRRAGERRGRSTPRRSFLFGGASVRERRLGHRLDLEVASVGTVLHGCRVGNAGERIDHVVVVPTGVWVVIADHRETRRGPRELDERLALADRIGDLVRSVLVQIDMDWVDVHPAVCFTNTRVRSSVVGGVRLATPRRLVREVGRRGPLLQADARRVAGAIGREIVIDGDPTRRTPDA